MTKKLFDSLLNNLDTTEKNSNFSQTINFNNTKMIDTHKRATFLIDKDTLSLSELNKDKIKNIDVVFYVELKQDNELEHLSDNNLRSVFNLYEK